MSHLVGVIQQIVRALRRGHAFMVMIMAFVLLISATSAFANEVKVGILAKRGDAQTLQRWASLSQYLSDEIPEHSFATVPLDFEEVPIAVQNDAIDFVLVNSGMYVQLESQNGVERIATMQNNVSGESMTTFGGVIFTHNKRKDITTFADLDGKTFAAVNINSFGGWIAALREFHRYDTDPASDFQKVTFLGTHDSVVQAVINGQFDAGTVRTDILEHMAAEQKIDLKDVRVIHPVKASDCPCLVSTPLYPEWPFARLASTPVALSEQVALALIRMPKDHPAAIQARIKGWTIPANYQKVHDAFKDLRIGPYTNMGELTTAAFIEKFKYQIIFTISAFLVISFTLAQYIRLNQRLKISEGKLKTLATHDPLTNLPNRRLFEEFATKAVHQAERNEKLVGLLFVDLNGFKNVNDQYGHAMGDIVLLEVSKRLLSCIRKGDMVARCGGDEFQILLTDVQDVRTLGEMARRLLLALKPPIQHGRKRFTIGASVGIACYPFDGTNVSTLQSNADDAMYAAKETGIADYRFSSDLSG